MQQEAQPSAETTRLDYAGFSAYAASLEAAGRDAGSDPTAQASIHSEYAALIGTYPEFCQRRLDELRQQIETVDLSNLQ